ncbi:MAG: general secretion pathway protein GspF, partial [Gammaproteobacteria bacterium]
MTKKQKIKLLSPDAPLRHENHARPITRREFVRQGFIGGSATLLGGGIFSLFANPNA